MKNKKDQSLSILKRIKDHINQFGNTDHLFLLDGLAAVESLLETNNSSLANEWERKYKEIEWEGDYPPSGQLLTESFCKALYQGRRRILKNRELLECPCHICGGRNTVDAPVEEDRDGFKVSYVCCHDCEMAIGDC